MAQRFGDRGHAVSGGPGATVTVSLNAQADKFLITHQSGNIVIANTTAGTTQNRQFDLYVGNGGFETGDFTDWTYVGNTNLSFPLAGDDVDVAGTNALGGEADTLFVHSGIYGAYLGQYPKDGSLSQTMVTTAGQQLLVSFWLTGVPYQGSTTPNGFAAKWNGSTLYAQTNLNAFGWTNMQFVVSAIGTRSTLEFVFNNVPGAFGLDDVTVGSVPAPDFQSAAVKGGAITFTWSALVNFSYQLQSSINPGNVGWTNVGGPITATGNVMSVSEPIGTTPQRFYRVIMLPNP